MKKLLAVLLAALLLAAPAFAQTASLAGEWTMTKTVASGVVMSPEAYGLSMTIVLNPDGTAFARQTINGAPMEENGTWAQNGNTVTITSQISEEVTTLTLQSDGTLLAMVDGVAMYFTQTAAAPQATNAPGGGLLPDGLLPSTGGTAPATGSFEGQWVLTKASANGQTIDPAAMGAQMTVTFNAGGTGTIWDGEESLACTWVQNGSTATVTEQDGYTWTFVMQADGTISVDVDGITLFMARQGGAALPSTVNPPAAAGGQTVTGNGFTLQVPQGWMELNEATLQQLIQTYGQAAVDAAGLSQQLQNAQSMGILLYYSADLNANMNVAQESAQGITMDTLPTLEADYAAAYASMGITNYDMAGPVEFSGRTYYTGTYDAVYPTMQYYYIVNNVFYTITLTNVSDADAAMILGSFTVNQ